jgi:hypothetical protein
MGGTTSAASAVAANGCFQELGADGGPFESFKNPYKTSRTGNTTIRSVASTSSVADDGTTTCSSIEPSTEDGDILIRVSGTVAHLDVYFCSKVGDNNGRLTKRDTTITNF